MKSTHDVSNDGIFEDLEALFARARARPPRSAEWIGLLRGLPPAALLPRPWTWVCAAAAALAALAVLGWPHPPTASAFPAIVAAMCEVGVVQCTVESSTSPGRAETWESRHHFFAQRHNGGEWVEFRDLARAEIATYRRDRDAIIVSTYEPGEAERNGRVQTLDDVLRRLESFAARLPTRWSRRIVERDGRPAIELTSQSDAENDFQHVLADARTHRLIESGNASFVTHFEYPEQGPRDLYDLGVPRTARVVDGRATEELLRLRERVMAGEHEFGPYRAAIVSCGVENEVQYVLTDGVRVRQEAYGFATDAEPAALVRMAREFIEQAPRGRLRRASIFNGDEETSVTFDERGAVVNRYVRPRAFATYRAGTLEGHARVWPGSFFGGLGDVQFDCVTDAQRGWVGIRRRGQADNMSRPYESVAWFDAAHDYRPVCGSRTSFPSAAWQLSRDWALLYARTATSMVREAPGDPPLRSESQVLEWAELRAGAWYPALRERRSLIASGDGSWIVPEPGNCATCQPVNHVAIAAEPLERVDAEQFLIPQAWLSVPAADR